MQGRSDAVLIALPATVGGVGAVAAVGAFVVVVRVTCNGLKLMVEHVGRPSLVCADNFAFCHAAALLMKASNVIRISSG